MVEIDVECGQGEVGAAVSKAALSLGLEIAMDVELAKYPGSRHWHLKKPGCAGTLEVTHWPAQNRLWVAYRANRVGDGWVAETAQEFAERLADACRGE